MQEEIGTGQVMGKGALGIMFYTGLRFLPFSFNTSPLWQLLLTSIILPKDENERGRAEQRINCYLTV